MLIARTGELEISREQITKLESDLKSTKANLAKMPGPELKIQIEQLKRVVSKKDSG